MISRIVCICVVLKCCFGQLDVHDECFSNGQEGVCKFVIQCKVAIENIRSSGAHKLKRCGFLGLSEIVCCFESGFGDRLNPDAPSEQEMTSQPPTSPLVNVLPIRPTTRPRPTQPPPPPPRAPPSRPATTPPPPRPLLTRATTATVRPTPRPPQNQNGGFASNSTTTDASQLRIADQECDKILKSIPPPLEQYIIGGNSAFKGEFPHSVAIGYEKTGPDDDDIDKNKLEFLCGGSLISQYYVMSAAHCFQSRGLRQRAPKLVRVGSDLGDPDSSLKYNPDTDFNFTTVILHPGYTMKNINDIALIRLQKPVPISELVHPGCLYTSDAPPTGNLIVIGFGITDLTDKQRQLHLQKATISYYPTEECKELYKPYQSRRLEGITDNMLCAGDKEGKKDACQGDSGGPLQVLSKTDGQYRIVGITSFGVSCGTNIPGVYTRVAAYLDWIEDVVWKSSYDDGRPLLVAPPKRAVERPL